MDQLFASIDFEDEETEHNLNTEIIQTISAYLTDPRTDPNYQINGLTSLICCCYYKQLEDVAIKLIDRGANINYQCATAETALLIAVQKNSVRIVEKLIEHNVALNTQNYNSLNFYRGLQLAVTALAHACREKMENIAIKLIDAGACLEYPHSLVIYDVLDFELNNIIEHLKFMYWNIVMEIMDDNKSLLHNCFLKNNGELNLIDLINDFAKFPIPNLHKIK